MKVTIDANILFAALIREGETRKLLTNPQLIIYTPAFIFTKLLKYKEEILKKSKNNKEELDYLIAIILKNINLVNDEELKAYIPAAQTLTTDTKDTIYFACALHKDTNIWTNDMDFKKQKRIKIHTTEELIKIVGKLG